MSKEIIKKASEVIDSRKDYIGGGMEAYAVLTLIDDRGYPASSTISISKADGVNWLTFITGANDAKAQRVAKCDKACVCLASSDYNITLVGRAEIITDPAVKKEHWQSVFAEHVADHNNPDYAILRFKTESYNLYFASEELEAKGVL